MAALQIVWFKRDLRIVDHRPLIEAAACGPLLPLFVVDDDVTGAYRYQGTVADIHELTYSHNGLDGSWTVTVNYDRINQSIASISTPTDTNNKLYPVYYDGSGSIQAMSATDVFDTFITQAIDTLVDGNDRDGTFRIHTATSLSGHTLISSTAVFTDTRANTGAYTAGGIPETLDQPTTITNYYLFRTNQGSAPSITIPLQIDGDNNLAEYSSGDFDAMLLAEIRHHAANTSGSTIRYNVDGSGNNRGSGMVNTILNGSGNRQTRFVNSNDYRAQEFPNGAATTANTYRLKINRV